MTYCELHSMLHLLSEDQLNMTVSVFNNNINEVFPVDDFCSALHYNMSDVIENEQPILVINE